MAEEGCNAVVIDLREGPSAERVTLVRVDLGMRRFGGSAGSRYGFFVVRRSGEVLSLGDDVWAPFHAPFASFDRVVSFISPLRDHAERELGIAAPRADTPRAGWHCCAGPSYFSEMWIERDNGRFCLAANLRHPFEGQIRHCGGGIGEGEGRAAYAPGYLAAQEAPVLTCPAFQRDSGRTECWTGGHPGLSLFRLADRRLVYIVTRGETTGRTVETPPDSIPRQAQVSRWYISVVDSCTRDVRSIPPFDEALQPRIEARVLDFLRTLDFAQCP
jgi:hypothetical protein